MYNHSRGVDKDEFEAVTWYRRAAEQGLPEAQYNLGVMYRQGRGVDLVDVATGECLERHNKVQALRWYRRAGQNGYEDAWAAIERLVSEDSVVDDERKSADGRTQQTNNNNNNNNNYNNNNKNDHNDNNANHTVKPADPFSGRACEHKSRLTVHQFPGD